MPNGARNPFASAPSRLQSQAGRKLTLGEHVIDVGTLRVLTRPDAPRLTPKAMAVLLELADHSGRTVTREELLDRVWAGTFPTPDVLTQIIKELRRALGDDQRSPKFIETIPKIGYRLLVPAQFQAVATGADAGDAASAAQSASQAETATAASGSETSVGSDSAAAIAPQLSPATRSRSWVRFFIGAGVLIALAALAIAFGLRRLPWPVGAGSAPYRVEGAVTLTSFPGPEVLPRLSADGSRVAYSMSDAKTQHQRMVVQLTTPSRPLPLSTGQSYAEMQPVWSRDGNSIAFMRYEGRDCRLIVVSALGGNERDLGPCVAETINYFDWSPDGRFFVTSGAPTDGKGGRQLVRKPLDGDPDEPLDYARSEQDFDLEPHYSPDGRLIALLRGIVPHSDLYIMSADGGALTQVTRLASAIRGYCWTPDSRALLFSSDHDGVQALYAVNVRDQAIAPIGVAPAEFPDCARTADVVAYQIPRVRSKLVDLNVADASAPQEIAAATGSNRFPAYSPQGDRVAFVSDRSGSQQLWIYDFANDDAAVVTDLRTASLRYPTFDRDGRHVLLTVSQSGRSNLVEVDLESQRGRVVQAAGEHVRFGAYGAAAHSFLVVSGAQSQHELWLYTESADGRAQAQRLGADISRAFADPQGSGIYFTKATQDGLFRRDAATGTEQLVLREITLIGRDDWQLRGGEVWYISSDVGRPLELRRYDRASATTQVVRSLDLHNNNHSFAIAPRGDHAIMTAFTPDETDIGLLHLRPAVACTAVDADCKDR